MDEQAELDRQLAVARRLRATTDIAARLFTVRDPEALARMAAEAVVDDLELAAAEMWLADGPDRLRLAAVAGDTAGIGRLVGDTVDVDTGATLVADVARTRLPVVLNDLGPPLTAAALTPILLDDELQGVLVAWSIEAVPVETADVLAAFASVVTASLNTAGVLLHEQTERQRLAFLAEATAILSASLDEETTIRNIELLALAQLADRCDVRVADAYESDTGEPVFDPHLLEVPMPAKGRVVGTISLHREAPFTADDLALAKELARRAGLALDNALLHRLVVQGEQRLRTFVDSLGTVLWEARADSLRFTFVNQQAEELFGYPAQDWLRDPDFFAGLVHPDDRQWVLDYWRDCADEGRSYEFEFRMVAADGRVLWMRTIVHVASDDRLVGVMVDVTQRRRFEDELHASREQFASLARTLQASLLPPHLPDMFGLEVAAHYRPAGLGVDVVGDFYDLFEVGDEGWGVVMGDVCGKGAEAAGLTALTRYTVRALAIRERLPSRVLEQLNEAVLAADTGERFCTAVYALLVPDGDGIACTVACGGHPLPLLLRSDGTVERVGRAGSLLGLWPEVELHDEGVALGPGDALVFYTDGAVEARSDGQEFGEERLHSVVRSCAGLRADQITMAIADAVADFEGETAGDDLALVVLRVPG